MEVSSFPEMEEEFNRRVQRIVWCSVATVDRSGRPRTRILHPVWEGSTGWICTGRDSHKAKHLLANPNVSLSYWDPEHTQVYVDAVAAWEDRPDEKNRVWELFQQTPQPYGYDPALFWPEGPSSQSFGALKLTPWRIELWSLADMVGGSEPLVWRA